MEASIRRESFLGKTFQFAILYCAGMFPLYRSCWIPCRHIRFRRMDSALLPGAKQPRRKSGMDSECGFDSCDPPDAEGIDSSSRRGFVSRFSSLESICIRGKDLLRVSSGGSLSGKISPPGNLSVVLSETGLHQQIQAQILLGEYSPVQCLFPLDSALHAYTLLREVFILPC